MNTEKLLEEKFPFLTTVSYMKIDYIGIIQHVDNTVVSIYVLDSKFTQDKKIRFLQLGEIWWWESNRSIPINLFLRDRFKEFKSSLKTFSKKEAEILSGPVLNITDLINKKLKKRTIPLIKV
jgi:hypothetical protein